MYLLQNQVSSLQNFVQLKERGHPDNSTFGAYKKTLCLSPSEVVCGLTRVTKIACGQL